MKNILIFALTLLLNSISLTVSAEGCDNNDAPKCLCTKEAQDLEAAKHLPAVRQAALDARQAFCLSALSETNAQKPFLDFLRSTSDWFSIYGGFKNNLNLDKAVLDAANLGTNSIPNLKDPFIDNPWDVGNNSLEVADVQKCEDLAADQSIGARCVDVLREFREFYGYVHHGVSIIGSTRNFSNLLSLKSEWDDYLDSTRGQTTLELMINGALYKKSEDNYFSSPPKSQLIVFHPLLVVENIDKAQDGQQLKESLAVELIGINYWKNRKWYKPSGASIVATYSDRPDVEDLGLGIAIHFNSTYSIGYTKRDEGSGVFITFDFLNLLNKKKNIVDNFF